MNTTTADLGAQIAEQRDKLAEAVTALAGKIDTTELKALVDKIDTKAITDKIGDIDTSDLRARAETGAHDLLDNATDSDGKPKRGLIIGAVVTLGVLVLVRRLLG